MKDLKETIGLHLKQARKTLGISTHEASSFLGVVNQTILNIEKGKARINVEQIYSLCSLYRVNPCALFPPLLEVKMTSKKKKVVRTTQERVFTVK